MQITYGIDTKERKLSSFSFNNINQDIPMHQPAKTISGLVTCACWPPFIWNLKMFKSNVMFWRRRRTQIITKSRRSPYVWRTANTFHAYVRAVDSRLSISVSTFNMWLDSVDELRAKSMIHEKICICNVI